MKKKYTKPEAKELKLTVADEYLTDGGDLEDNTSGGVGKYVFDEDD